MLWMTALLLRLEFSPALYIFVYAATLFTYNIQRLFKAGAYLEPQILGRHRWILERRPALHALTVLAGLVMSGCVFFVPLRFLLWLLPAGCISLLYFVPFISSGQNRKRLREVPLLKINLVGFTWVWALLVAPALTYGVSPNMFWSLAVFEFFLCFGLTVPFDIRDSRHDRQEGTRTFVSEWGVRLAKGFSVASLLTGLFFLLFAGLGLPVFLFFVTWVLLACFSVSFASENRDELYYGFWLDGFIVLQGPLLYGLMRLM